MSDFIPQELWLQIFKKSVPEALVRCRCVCKSWRSIISSPSFIAAHLGAQKPQLLVRESSDNLQQIGSDNFFLFHPQNLPNFDLCFRSYPLHNYHIIGTVNGVICLVDETSEVPSNIILWNPRIRKCLFAPASPYSSPHRRFSSTFGFGFDPKSNDLKIVRIVWNSTAGPFGRAERFPSNAEVLSVGQSTWRPVNLDDNLDLCMFTNRWSQCLLNGSAHWAAYMRSSRDVLFSFNFEKEEFKIIELPKELPRAQTHVSKLGSLLSVLSYKRALRVLGSQGCDIWAMQVYGDATSWCKMVSFRWDGGGVKSVLWVKEDGSQMVVSTEDQDLVSCDSSNQNAKLLGVSCKGDGYFADDFVGSLVLLDSKEF